MHRGGSMANSANSMSASSMLSAKVMRLTKPSLMLTQPILCGDQDLPGSTLLECHERDLASVKGMPNFALGELLTLPQNFGNIFLGETFSSYISVHNDSTQVCKDILVKADLQTSSQRLVLSGANGQPVAELHPEANIDDVIHHEVKELGTHILVCAVSYVTSTGEKRYFRKFFKFQVLKPLDVRTNFYNTEEKLKDFPQSDEVYMEAQIQNITPGPIYVERISLDPSQQYTARHLNTVGNKENETGVFGAVNYMNPLDIRQYLYCLRPKKEMYDDPKLLRGVTNIGKLDIVWKTNMGEKGRLQTSPLHRVISDDDSEPQTKAPGYGDIRLTVESLPDAVQVEHTFNFTVKVTNCCERTMDLVLVLENKYLSAGLLWCGISGRQLGKLKPNSCLTLDLTLIASKPGLQTISGLRLTDTFLKRTYEHDGIAQVFVYADDFE